MAGNSKGLGKGLGALMGDDMMDLREEKNSLLLPVSQVESCAAQPRKLFDPDALADLADSIRQHGIIQPLTVRKLQSGYYQILAGERRWRAARMAGLTQVPAVVIEADDRKAMELAMIENLQREDLNPIEEAEGYKVLMEQYGMTQEETAKRVGKSRPAVANAMRLLHLCEPVRAMVEDGRLSGGHAPASSGSPCSAFLTLCCARPASLNSRYASGAPVSVKTSHRNSARIGSASFPVRISRTAGRYAGDFWQCAAHPFSSSFASAVLPTTIAPFGQNSWQQKQ